MALKLGINYPLQERSNKEGCGGGGGGGGGGGRGKVSPRRSAVQSACQYDVTSRVSDFQNGEQSVHRRDG